MACRRCSSSVALARPQDAASRLPSPLVFLGDASYSLYLVHLLALTATRLVAIRLGLAPTSVADGVALGAVGIAAAIAAGSASYLLFERPVTRWLRRRWERSSS